MKNYIKYYLLLSVALIIGATFAGCQDDFDAPEVNVPQATIQPNITIAELKELFWNDATNYADSIYDPENPDTHYVIAGRVVSSDEASNVFKSLVIQDETAAIALSINSYNLYLNYRVGQEIVVDLTGMHIGKYNGYQQLGRPEWYANGNAWEVTFMSPEFFAAHAQLNGLPDVSKIDTLTVPNFSILSINPENLRKYQSQLVRLQNVHFENGGKEKFSTYHSSGDNQNLVDQSGLTLTVRTSGYSNFWNQLLPTGNLDVVGILSFYGTTGWQLILIDEAGCMPVGERPGAKDNPYTVQEAIAAQAAGGTAQGWVKGYIVGTLQPEVETVTSSSDIAWEAPFLINNTLVVGPTADTRDIQDCLLVPLAMGSAFQKFGNLRDNETNLGKEVLFSGTLTQYMGTYGVTGNNGTTDEFEISGLDIPTGEFPQGNGEEATPYNVAQIVAMNPTSTQEAVASGVWVKGYIVGSMPTGGSSTTLAGAVFGLADAATTNLVLGPTADCTDPNKCVGVQLPTSMRDALALANVPGNLGKVLAVQGDIMKYCGGPGVKNLTSHKLEDGDTPNPPTPPVGEAVSSLDEKFESTSTPTGWTNTKVSGDKSWYFTTFDNNGYAAMTGYKGTQPPFDSWLISPAIDMSKVTNKVLTFDNQVNGYGSTTTTMGVFVLTSNDPSTATKTELQANWAQAPASGYSGFVASGNIDLSAYSGTIFIGFRYYASQDANYATWCIDNVKLNASGDTPTPPDPPTPPTPPTPSGDEVSILATSIPNVPGVSTVEGYTFDLEKGSGATAPAKHESTSAIRIYANNTISISGGRMVKIVFTLANTMRYRYTDLTPSTGTISPAQATGDTTVTWVGDASEVTFTVGALGVYGSEPTKPGQIHFTKIEIFPAD